MATIFHPFDVRSHSKSKEAEPSLVSDPKSLNDIASKLQGRHLLSDGRPVIVTAEYLTTDQVKCRAPDFYARGEPRAAYDVESHLYVVDGLSYVENVDAHGGVSYVTHKFSLQDARFSDSRREVSFDRLTEDAGKVQGLLFLQAAPQ
jgi:hypothetical protein